MSAEDEAVRGWMALFETIHGEWGPYDADKYLADDRLIGAPEWLMSRLAEELAKAPWI